MRLRQELPNWWRNAWHSRETGRAELTDNTRSSLPPGVRSALDAGHIVVLFCLCGGSVESARAASRALCSWLHGVAVFPAGGLSRSATPGLAAVAAQTAGPVGLDVEALVSDGTLADIGQAMLHADEQRTLPLFLAPDVALSLWVRKEAVLKAFGVGLAVSPRTICTGPFEAAWRGVESSNLGWAAVRSLPCPAGFAAAISTRGDRLPEVSVFNVPPQQLRADQCV